MPADVASTWFEQLYDVVKAERTAPPQAARIYGIAAVALYEAIVDGTRANRSLAGQLNGLKSVPKASDDEHDWPAVANAALAETIRRLFPALSQASTDAVNGLEQRYADQLFGETSQSTYERSVAYGRAVAGAIIDWSGEDGLAATSSLPYTPTNVPGGWEPTPPQFGLSPLAPGWGKLRTMVMTSGAELSPPGHPEFSSGRTSDFYAAAAEVYNAGISLTAEQKLIADYWSDGAGATGTPPGHWIAIVSQISRNDQLSLAASAEAYARVGIAVNDSFVCCWNAKYAFDLQRPVTYIQRNIDASWLPHIATPSFPSYTSGHSTQSAAAARILTDMLGIKPFTDTTHTDHALAPRQEPRRFGSFEEAASEAAVSRLFGGIHYAFDNDHGLTSGRLIADKILQRVTFRSR